MGMAGLVTKGRFGEEKISISSIFFSANFVENCLITEKSETVGEEPQCDFLSFFSEFGKNETEVCVIFCLFFRIWEKLILERRQ